MLKSPLAPLATLLLIIALGAWPRAAFADAPQVLMVDGVGDRNLDPAADILSVSLLPQEQGTARLRVSFLSLQGGELAFLGGSGREKGGPARVSLQVRAGREGDLRSAGRADLVPAGGYFRLEAGAAASGPWRQLPDDRDALYLDLPADPARDATPADPWHVEISVALDGSEAVEVVRATYPAQRDYTANCAFVLHGNQGLGYSDVFHGRSDDPEGSGFDENLQIHQGRGVPGNFHLSGTLQSSAEWSANNGDPVDFNAWLAAGVTEGWAGMITSAYAQHIMPFVNDDMNNWAVHTETQMIDHRYGYYPTVAWVPERVWLNTGGYPSAGVNDWIGDNWQQHGVQGVILDDDVHLAGHDNHQIHTLSANRLRLIPRDRDFTGNIIGGNGQASLDILTGLAGSGLGQYRIAVFAEDWEAASEMGGWAGIVPFALDTYEWFINKCADESAWLNTWKLADALNNADFTGNAIEVTPGTYWEIGGTDGYGGANNAWYTHWAGWVPYVTGGDGNGNCAGAGGSCADYGSLWNSAYGALMAAPDNNISQAGWYVLMTNLYETGWHDGLGGPISGWQHNYAAHIKNAMIYAEAAHWAAGEFGTMGSYWQDIDGDGGDELILHNDKLFAVFETIGGRMTHLFSSEGGGHVVIGVDNAYWSGTSGDYNDDNHVGAFSDVSPNYQHDEYDMFIAEAGGGRVVLRMIRNEITRDVALEVGDSFFDVTYRVGPGDHWWQAGFSPSLVDLIWNARLDRVWEPADGYLGWRNPGTGMAAGWLIGSGGAAHQRDFSGTLMKGDELTGSGTMQMRLFAGHDPDGSVMAALAGEVIDTLGPRPTEVVIMGAAGQVRFTFDQATAAGAFAAGEVSIGGIDLAGAASTGEAAFSLAYVLDTATMEALLALAPEERVLAMAAGAVQDAGGVDGPEITGADAIPVSILTGAVSIDGDIGAAEWEGALVLDDAADSDWTSSNEIDRLLARWDAEYLYLAIDGQVSGNSWLLYLDVDPGAGTGADDLSAIDAWERGAVFTYPGAGIDFQYGCYQHQGPYDSDGFWRIESPIASTDISDQIQSAFDSYHTHGATSGSELAIPWDTLYGLGAGNIPVGAQLGLVAAICWDPEPDGALGGDSAPSNVAAPLPTIDNVWTIALDTDGNGIPDGTGVSAAPDVAALRPRLLPNVPNPFNPSTNITFEIPGDVVTPVDVAIYDIRGRRIDTLFEGPLAPGRHTLTWHGRAATGHAVAAGTYFCRFQCQGQALTRPISLIK